MNVMPTNSGREKINSDQSQKCKTIAYIRASTDKQDLSSTFFSQLLPEGLMGVVPILVSSFIIGMQRRNPVVEYRKTDKPYLEFPKS